MNVDQLKNRDFYVVIDRSGSMTERDTQSGKSRWEEAKESTIAIANRVNEFDPDGISVVMFNSDIKTFDNVGPDAVKKAFTDFEPTGSTSLTKPLEYVFNDYLTNRKNGKAKTNGALMIVVTDGIPDDQAAVAKSISSFTQNLKDGRAEFGIEFIQVGKDSGASSFLKRLDDNLTTEGAKYDIVNTITMEEMGNKPLVDVLIQALTQ